MADDLRRGLVASFEHLAADLTIEKHGDPHVAFIVLCYPDREPAVLAARRGKPPYNLTDLKLPKDDEAVEGEPFPMAEFDEAKAAMDDASLGFIIGGHGGYGVVKQELGDCISERIAGQWTRRRMAPIEAALASADYETANPHNCEKCRRRFKTERGLKMHVARSVRCGQVLGNG